MSAPIVHTGTVTIHFGSGSLFRDFPVPMTTDTRSSAYKYLEIWLGEITHRYPATNFVLVLSRDDDPPEIDASTHSSGEEIIAEMARIALELHDRRDEWLVQRHTDESKAYWKRYPVEENNAIYQAEPEDDDGPEAEDPS